MSYPDPHLHNFISAFYNAENRHTKVTLQSRKNKPLKKELILKLILPKSL